jgi:hypothetical protein
MKLNDHDLKDGASWTGFVRNLTIFFPLAHFDLLRDIIGDLLAHCPVDGKLVQRGYLGRTIWTNKVLFE